MCYKGTCAYNAQMEFIPFLIEIGPKAKVYYENYNYLLQVWTKGGKLIFEQKLKERIKQWAISFDNFIFKTVGSDQYS